MSGKYIPIDWSKIQAEHICPRIPRYLNFTNENGWELADEPSEENKAEVVS